MMPKCPTRFLLMQTAILLSTLRLSAQSLPSSKVSSTPPDHAFAVATFDTTYRDYLVRRDPLAAKGGFEKAISLDPSYALPRFHLALLAEAEGDWDASIRWFSQFLTLTKDQKLASKARTEMAIIGRLRQMDATPEGKKRREYDESINHAIVLLRSGFPKESVAEAANATKIDSARWESYAVAADALLKQKAYGPAIPFLQQAIDRAPSGKQQELKTALKECHDELDYSRYELDGVRALDAKDYVTAANRFGLAWKLFPVRGDTGLAYGVSLAMSGQYNDATAVLSGLRGSSDADTAQRAKDYLAKLSYRKVATSDADKIAGEADILYAQGKWTQAETAYTKALTSQPTNPDWNAALAMCAARQNHLQEAEARLKKAISLQPNRADWLAKLGAIQLREQKNGDAVDSYRAAVTQEPGNAALHDQFGTALYYAGDRVAAAKEYSAAVRLDTSNKTYAEHLQAVSAVSK